MLRLNLRKGGILKWRKATLGRISKCPKLGDYPDLIAHFDGSELMQPAVDVALPVHGLALDEPSVREALSLRG